MIPIASIGTNQSDEFQEIINELVDNTHLSIRSHVTVIEMAIEMAKCEINYPIKYTVYGEYEGSDDYEYTGKELDILIAQHIGNDMLENPENYGLI